MSPNEPSKHLKTLLSETDLEFISSLHTELNPERLNLLKLREERQQVYDKGEIPTYLPESEAQNKLEGKGHTFRFATKKSRNKAQLMILRWSLICLVEMDLGIELTLQC